MPSQPDLAAFKRGLDAFTGRISALRADPAVETALIELENAEEELRVCAEEIERLALLGGDDARQGAMLRRAFQDLPTAVFVLDRNGVIRGLNRHAAAMLGVTAFYAVGKPFAVFVELPWRVSFRCELSDAMRESRLGLVSCRVGSGGRRTPPLELRLTPPETADSEEALMLITVDPAPPEHEHQEIMAAAGDVRRLDIMGRMTRMLLGAGERDQPPLLDRVAGLLAGECADFVVIDLVEDRAVRRASVAGPGTGDGAAAFSVPEALDRLDPSRSQVTRYIVETGESMLHIPLWEEGALGGDGEAVPVVRALGTGAAAGVAIRDDTHVYGALLLIREKDRPAFTITDLALYEELGVHIGMALEREADQGKD
ncbi:PAS domain-containing protein [Actinomadura barringtoniae]|uniref:PAS domain-containing protein n=1 Tax=Actinomadura barringtoniae TaxID=1427535 RepID=A0A939T837_9ACTN|nr:PAS domain-containing protein [Actinomadura barringtoniae]MBO2449917.1 PAS domain-containing protein [Actinomadura barringtoniae]